MDNETICRKVSSMLSLYIENQVSVQERAFIEEHLIKCTSCHKKFLYLKNLINDLKDSYKQILELAKKKQVQQSFSIREHEAFMGNISSYVDNELDVKDCIEFRRYLMKSKMAQKELKSIYRLQRNIKNSHSKVENSVNKNISKNVMKALEDRQRLHNKSGVKEVVFSPKVLKIAILSGLILLGGYEFEQLVQPKQNSPQVTITSGQITQKMINLSRKINREFTKRFN